ncbi:hypothetical protein LOC71_01100 [Rhodopirellula sp. JC740]|uniref:Uncharacterized protein n=1 Tax=Rhodopirellula halodulae TaxID=2894198 RepID=A0ABS8NBB7_9BACT|nr:hypothetical protein [Rhodopirellula sp. JC740]
MTTPSTAEYLKTMLEINPVWQSASALQLRRQKLGLPNHESQSSGEESFEEAMANHETRKQARESVATLQKQFFHLSDDELSQRLSELNPKSTPELSATIHRLKTAASERNSFVDLLADDSFDRELVVSLGKAIVLPSSEAGYVRERYLQSLTTKSVRKKAASTSKRIAAQYPALFELERDWLLTLQNPKTSGPASARYTDWGSFRLWFIVIIVVLQIIRIIARG